MDLWAIVFIIAVALCVASNLIVVASRYKRCPPNKLLIITGNVGAGRNYLVIRGGGKFVMALIQDYAYISLAPMSVDVKLDRALSAPNDRVDLHLKYIIAVGTEEEYIDAAVTRLLNLSEHEIKGMAGEILSGQTRLAIAAHETEDILKLKPNFIQTLREETEPQLKKVGLHLIDVSPEKVAPSSEPAS